MWQEANIHVAHGILGRRRPIGESPDMTNGGGETRWYIRDHFEGQPRQIWRFHDQTGLRTPRQSGQGFRFDVGQRSDLIPATVPK